MLARVVVSGDRFVLSIPRKRNLWHQCVVCMQMCVFIIAKIFCMSALYKVCVYVRERHWGARPFVRIFIYSIVLYTPVYLSVPLSLISLARKEIQEYPHRTGETLRSPPIYWILYSFNRFANLCLTLSSCFSFSHFCARALSVLQFVPNMLSLALSLSYSLAILRSCSLALAFSVSLCVSLSLTILHCPSFSHSFTLSIFHSLAFSLSSVHSLLPTHAHTKHKHTSAKTHNHTHTCTCAHTLTHSFSHIPYHSCICT